MTRCYYPGKLHNFYFFLIWIGAVTLFYIGISSQISSTTILPKVALFILFVLLGLSPLLHSATYPNICFNEKELTINFLVFSRTIPWTEVLKVKKGYLPTRPDLIVVVVKELSWIYRKNSVNYGEIGVDVFQIDRTISNYVPLISTLLQKAEKVEN